MTFLSNINYIAFFALEVPKVTPPLSVHSKRKSLLVEREMFFENPLETRIVSK